MKYKTTKRDAHVAYIPHAIQNLPVNDQGYRVPWFVGPEGDFRKVDSDKAARVYRENLCWITGAKMHGRFTFAGGPLAATHRTYSEPPTLWDAAVYAVQVCPFMLLPKSKRRTKGMEHIDELTPDNVILDNPGEWHLIRVTAYGLRRYVDIGTVAEFDPKHVVAHAIYREGKLVVRKSRYIRPTEFDKYRSWS